VRRDDQVVSAARLSGSSDLRNQAGVMSRGRLGVFEHVEIL
jgi:hypothetical protein